MDVYFQMVGWQRMGNKFSQGHCPYGSNTGKRWRLKIYYNPFWTWHKKYLRHISSPIFSKIGPRIKKNIVYVRFEASNICIRFCESCGVSCANNYGYLSSRHFVLYGVNDWVFSFLQRRCWATQEILSCHAGVTGSGVLRDWVLALAFNRLINSRSITWNGLGSRIGRVEG